MGAEKASVGYTYLPKFRRNYFTESHPMRAIALFAILPFVLAGCSTTLEPRLAEKPISEFDLVDRAQVDTAKYENDYAQCARLANQDVVDMTRTAANALNTAADKASMGILGGKASKHADRQSVLKRCLTGRGYSVLR